MSKLHTRLYRLLLKRALQHDRNPSISALLILAPSSSSPGSPLACFMEHAGQGEHPMPAQHSVSDPFLVQYLQTSAFSTELNPPPIDDQVVFFPPKKEVSITDLVMGGFLCCKKAEGEQLRIATATAFAALQALSWCCEKAERHFYRTPPFPSLPVGLTPVPTPRPGVFLVAHPLNQQYPRSVIYLCAENSRTKELGGFEIPTSRRHILATSPQKRPRKRRRASAAAAARFHRAWRTCGVGS
eukprot:RCo008934